MAHKYPRTSLLDLPVRLWDRDRTAASERISNAYVAERKELRDSTQLRPFIRRWRNLWLLRPGPLVLQAHPLSWLARADGPLEPDEVAMLEGHFDAKRVMMFLAQQPAEGPLTLNPAERDWRICMNLCIPNPLLCAFEFSRVYGVGHDLGLVRLFLDSYPALNNRMRGETPSDRGSYLNSEDEAFCV